MVTKKQIADALGVSRTAVSMVLNDSSKSTVSKATREKILRAAAEMGYVAKEQPREVLFVLYGVPAMDPSYDFFLGDFEEAFSNHGYRVSLIIAEAGPKGLAKIRRTCRQSNFDGVMMTGEADRPLVALFEELRVRYLIFAVSDLENCNIVMPDLYRVGRLCTERQLALGHRDIALFLGKMSIYSNREFLRGYRDALAAAGVPQRNELVQCSDVEDGYELGGRLDALGVRHTAVCCATTVIQLRAVSYYKDSGRKVPEEMSLIGYGLTRYVRMSTPELTAVDYAPEYLAQYVFDRFERMLGEKKPFATILLSETSEYAGGTVAPPPRGV